MFRFKICLSYKVRKTHFLTFNIRPFELAKPVLTRHYTDFSPERLKRIYDGAGLKVLD